MEDVNGFCVDSDILIDYLRGATRARDFLFTKAGIPLFISVVSIVEIHSGKETTIPEKKEIIDSFLTQFRVITLTPVIAKRAGELRRDYDKPFADMIVAASALEYRLTLITRNLKHFRLIKGLKISRPY